MGTPRVLDSSRPPENILRSLRTPAAAGSQDGPEEPVVDSAPSCRVAAHLVQA